MTSFRLLVNMIMLGSAVLGVIVGWRLFEVIAGG